MSACTFFGHRRCYRLDRNRLKIEIEKLINGGVDTFYVGNHGEFDSEVYSALKEMRKEYPHIKVFVTLAYLPDKNSIENPDSIYPEGLESVPPKFAIDKRNRIMIAQADFCICHIDHTWGGAYKYWQIAKKRGLHTVNLGSTEL